jgi:hypothetical protein
VGIWGVFRDKVTENQQTFAARIRNRELKFPDVLKKLPVLLETRWSATAAYAQ